MLCATADVLYPIIAKPGTAPISAVGTSLVVREWTMSGPKYLHVHQYDDEAWHVLEGRLQFQFSDGRSMPLQARQCLCPPAWRTPIAPSSLADT